MRNFWNKVWIGFRSEFTEKQNIRNLIEFIITIVLFTVINSIVFDGKDSSYTTMLAGCALYLAISTRRRLDNK
jgi:hypothetical protein